MSHVCLQSLARQYEVFCQAITAGVLHVLCVLTEPVCRKLRSWQVISSPSLLQGRLDIETQCRGFLDLAKLATTKLANLIFQESALLDVFHLLYHTEEWTSGNATATILATLNDYFHDYERFIDSSNFKR